MIFCYLLFNVFRYILLDDLLGYFVNVVLLFFFLLHLHDVEGLYFHYNLSVCVSVCLSVCPEFL